MSEIAKTKWLPRHLLCFSFDIYILSCRTELMTYYFERHEYHYLVFNVCCFGKTIFDICVGRNERMERAHDVYKRMSDEYRNVPDDRTVGVDKGTDMTDSLRKHWKRLLNI